MQTSTKKKNPSLRLTNKGYSSPFVSKYKYYLSEKKIDMDFLNNKKTKGNPREIFNTYPIYLQHTIFFNGEDFKKVREL